MGQTVRLELSTTQLQKQYRVIACLATVLLASCIYAEAEALTSPAHPIILVHGWRSDGGVWGTFVGTVAAQGWTFGGDLQYRDGRISGISQVGDIYTITFTSDHNLDYLGQAAELEGVINHILELTGKSKVICVGHSMGGLACRAYLKYARTPKVSQIITVGTPHLGAPWDRLLFLAGISPGISDPSTAVRILQVGSPEIEELNTDTLYRYRDTPVAYSSIVVDNDDIVPELSQSLASVSIDIPLHNEVRIQLNSPCGVNRLNHLCETTDDNVRVAIVYEIVRRPVALVLKAETPVTRHSLPLRLKLLASSANRSGDLYLAVSPPGGGFLFQRKVGSGHLDWTTEVIPAANSIPAEETRTVDLSGLEDRALGSFGYYAVLARPGADPFSREWYSNLAHTRFRIEPRSERITITFDSLPPGFVGWPYEWALNAIGGTPPYSWLVVDGSVPAGLAVGNSGTITGSPTNVGVFSFALQVQDRGSPPQSATVNLTIEVRKFQRQPTTPSQSPNGGPSDSGNYPSPTPSAEPSPPSGGGGSGGGTSWGEVPPSLFN